MRIICGLCGGDQDDHPWPEQGRYLEGCIKELRRRCDRHEVRARRSRVLPTGCEVVNKRAMVIFWSEEDAAYVAVCPRDEPTWLPNLRGVSAFGLTYEDAARELSLAIELAEEVEAEDRA